MSLSHIFNYQTGTCKEYSLLMANTMLAAGSKLYFIRNQGNGPNEDGHAFLLVRIFEKPTSDDFDALLRMFKKHVELSGIKTHLKSPLGMMMDDGFYIFCDPANFEVAGMVLERDVINIKKEDMIELRPECYGRNPAPR